VKLIPATVILLIVIGCAATLYRMPAPLSPSDTAQMSCLDVAMEAGRINVTQMQLDGAPEVRWSAVAGYLGEETGTAMTRSDAQRALQTRAETVRNAQIERVCVGR
jgi:hypothetical protein